MKRAIAIVGVSGRFPKSNNIREFWDHLVNERELIHFFSDEELQKNGVDPRLLEDANYVKAASFIDSVSSFDYPFFKYTREEAAIMNPQTRMMHQLVWEALEDASCDLDRYHKKTGIFVGANKDLNWSLYAALNPTENVDELTKSKLVDPNFMGSLISYKLNFGGPCYFIDTACSTSLSTAHLACRSLLLNECGTAVVGGIRLLSFHDYGYSYQEGSIMSKDGHNRSFDQESTGTLGADGAGVVILKRLEDALEEKDHIYAVIRGSAMNNDGNAKAGYTMPSVRGQTECIKLAQKIAGVSPSDISYVETHGTGTKIGDPIEIESLNKAFNNGEHSCAIGTIKSSMGHADEAAGIAGLLKTTLSLKHGVIPASLHFNNANPTIPFDEGPFSVNYQTKNWERPQDKPRIAAISSLGIGGTNVHMILQEAPERQEAPDENVNVLIRYSALNENALLAYKKSLINFLETEEHVSISDLAYTLQAGRKTFHYGHFFVVNSREELKHKLQDDRIKTHQLKQKNKTVFLFSGQGSQYVNMGKGLYEFFPQFKATIDEGLVQLEKMTGTDFYEILFGGKDDERINHTRYTQPILFLFEYALAKLLLDLGVRPDSMIGHSLGEYTAACISGVFSMEDALTLINTRAQLMDKVEQGDMLSVAGTIANLEPSILEGIDIAAINSPGLFVLSGNSAKVKEVAEKLKAKDITHSYLKTSHAFHSEMMDEILEEFESAFSTVKPAPPSIPFVSNLTGDFIKDEEAISPEYWKQHLRGTVNFYDGIKKLGEQGNTAFIEIGPGNTLSTFCKQSFLPEWQNQVSTTIRHPKEKMSDHAYFLTFLGNLWTTHKDIDWKQYYGDKLPNRISAPTYVFDTYELPSKVSIDEEMKNTYPMAGGRQSSNGCFFIPSWKMATGTKLSTPRSKNTVLVFSDDSELMSACESRLKNQGDVVIRLLNGDTYEEVSENCIRIEARNQADYQQVRNYLIEKDLKIDTIIYGWSLTDKNKTNQRRDGYDSLNLSYNQVHEVLTQLVAPMDSDVIFSLLTTKSCDVIGEGERVSHQNHVSALLNVAAQEMPHLSCLHIDLDQEGDSMQLAQWIGKEIATNKEPYQQVAYRNRRRWVTYFENLELPTQRENLPLIRKGTYVFAGHLDSLVYFLSKYLLTSYEASVVVLIPDSGKKTIPDEEYKSRSKELLQLPGHFETRIVDFDQSEELTRVVDEISEQFQKINGWIHTVKNVFFDQMTFVETMDRSVIKSHFDCHVKSLINLNEVLKDKPLDFIRVMSSLSSFVGGISYGAYASSHALMDDLALSYAMELRKQDISISVVNLDRIAEEGQEWLSEEDCVNMFETSLFWEEIPQWIISKRDINQPLNTVKEEKKQENVELNRDLLATVFEAAETEIQQQVVGIVEDLFGVNGIGINDDFFELGGDSLKGMMFINKVKKRMGVHLEIADIFSGSTLTDITELIEEKRWLSKDEELENELVI